MRYYSFILDTSTEKIEKNSIIKLRDYDFDSALGAMNAYIYNKLINGVSFLAYREDAGDSVYAVFAYDESKNNMSDAYGSIIAILGSTFRVKRLKEEPCEITGEQFFECILEAKRRTYFRGVYRITENAGLRIYDECYRENVKVTKFSFEEKIISEAAIIEMPMRHKSFAKELSNIRKHNISSECKGNMVHYIISGRSMAAVKDMAETLVSNLYAANRIGTKRMIFVKDIDPEVYKGSNYLESLIQNNLGGVVAIDLTERFAHDPVEYGMASKFLENLVKTYRNQCLFIFTYNMENPGFSFQLLPQLNKYMLPVVLKEGSGDRTAAVDYMKQLIKTSEYAKYANQAQEFMNRFPGNTFSQTDVLDAYEQFESWCINKNIIKAYDYDISDDFMLDRDENTQSAYDTLKSLIGLNIVKEQIEHILAADIVEKERKCRLGSSYNTSTMHMIFSGNPGSAKTTVAKLFAGIAKEKGIIKSGAIVERSGTDLCCRDNIRNAFEAAKGGVLFIDEAYAIAADSVGTTLIQEMENKRDQVIVILAGYNDRMKAFMQLNEGLKSRIPYWVDFPDYDENELTEIFKLMLKQRNFTATEEAIKAARHIFERVRYAEDFGNGRYVRNLMERAIKNQSVRLVEAKGDMVDVPKDELFLITKEDLTALDEGLKDEREAGTAMSELEEMVGLFSVKSVIKKAIANFKLNKLCLDRGIHRDKGSLHMVFTGNPGTAKTTVARLFAEILKDEKVLPTGNFVEASRADLIAQHVGGTAPKVKRKFKEARGGVLFIDEAYSLCDGCKGSFGDEAINTIVQEMENHRDDVIVVFAGYPKEMQEFLDRNPGLTSRIAFRVNFEDYSVDELMDITRLMLSRKKMSITDKAMDKLKVGYEAVHNSSDYGNGRFVRKVLEEAEMNLAQRLSELGESELTTELLTTVEVQDIPDMSDNKYNKYEGKNPIGFCIA